MKLRNKLSRRLAAFLLCAVVTVGALRYEGGRQEGWVAAVQLVSMFRSNCLLKN